MGVVCIVVDANWNTGCSDQRVSLDSVRVGNRSRGRVRPSFSACSLPALPTVLSEEDDSGFLESIQEFWRSALSFNKRSFRIAVAAG